MGVEPADPCAPIVAVAHIAPRVGNKAVARPSCARDVCLSACRCLTLPQFQELVGGGASQRTCTPSCAYWPPTMAW